MKFRVTKIAAAVATGLGVSVAGVNVAQADDIFFPYIVMSPTVTTILTVINDDSSAVKQLHYRYYRKEAPATNTSSCNEFDFWQDTSANDVVSFDMGGVFGNSNGVLFEPTQTKPAAYTADFATLGHTNSKEKRGYVLVDNSSPTTDSDPLPAPAARLAGEAIVIQFATGSAWGYRAYNSAGIWSFDGTNLALRNRYDFSDRVEVNGEVLAEVPSTATRAVAKTNYWAPIAFMPWDEATTKFFVTPVATKSPFQGPDSTSSISATIRLSASSQAVDRVVFNRDETPYSGFRSQSVTCVGAVALADLVDENVKQQTPQGGWSYLQLTSGQAVVMKAEYNPVSPSSLDDVTVSGSWNNVTWLRKGFRETLPRALTVAGWPAIPTFEISGLENNSPYPVLDSVALTAAGLSVLPPQPTGVTLQRSLAAVTADATTYYDDAYSADPVAVAAAIAAGKVFVSTAQ